MVDWQLLAIVAFSVAGGLLVGLLLVISVCIRRRRCVRRHHTAEVVQLRESLKAIERDNEAKEEAVSTLRRSVADFDAEKSLLLKRLDSCDKPCTQEDIRNCLRDLQLHVAVQAANASSIHKAVDMEFRKGPPALLAEVWLIHGEPQKAREESGHPSTDEPQRRVFRSKRPDGVCKRNHKSVYEDAAPTSTVVATCMSQPLPLQEFHTCAAHWAHPPCGGDPQLLTCEISVTAQPTPASATFQTNAGVLPETAGACCGETTALHAGSQATEEALTKNLGTTRCCGENDATGCPCFQERCGRAATAAMEGPSACQGAGISTFTGDTEFSRTSNCCAAMKECCDTAIIPAHTFAPEYIFVAEQWLPGPSETAKFSCHQVPLTRLAKFSRRDHSKTASLENEVYQQVLLDAQKFEKVLISSKQTQDLNLVSSSRDHVKLQSRALADVLPALHISSKAIAFPHLCYSLVEYTFDQIKSISTRAIRSYIGDTLHQPLSLVVRVFERKSVPGATPAASPANKDDGLVTDEEQESWTFLYETPPAYLSNADGRVVEDETVDFCGGASFRYKHAYMEPRPLLVERSPDSEVPPAGRQYLSTALTANQAVAPCTTQTADRRSFAHDGWVETTAFPAGHLAKRTSLTKEASEQCARDGTVVIGRRAGRGERQKDYDPRAAEFTRKPRIRASPSTCEMMESCELVKSSSTHEDSDSSCRSPRRGCILPRAPSCDGMISAAQNYPYTPPAEEPESASAARFKHACLDQQGKLYEDDILSVSCVVGTTITPDRNVLHASVELSIVHRKYAASSAASAMHDLASDTSDPSCVTGFHAVHTTVENVERDALSCSVTPIVRAPPSGPGNPARVCQTISATVMQPFQFVPEVSLKVVLLDGSEKKCTFALPLVIAQFMRPVELMPAAFMQLWFDGTLHPRRLSIRISSHIKAAGPRELVKVVTLNGKLDVVRGIRHPLAEGSIFAIGELAAIGDMEGESRCLVRLWQSHHATSSMAKLEIKAEHRRLLDAVSELLTYLLQDSE